MKKLIIFTLAILINSPVVASDDSVYMPKVLPVFQPTPYDRQPSYERSAPTTTTGNSYIHAPQPYVIAPQQPSGNDSFIRRDGSTRW